MKSIFLLLSLILLASCDPWGFGFKRNPAFILKESLESIVRLDHERLLSVSGKEVLCLYANPEGISHLHENFRQTPSEVSAKPNLIATEHFDVPEFVGYWAYYYERFRIDVKDKSSNKTVIEAYVDCHYGTKNAKDDKLENLDKSEYKTKDCKLVKLVPKNFSGLNLTQRCEMLRVKL